MLKFLSFKSEGATTPQFNIPFANVMVSEITKQVILMEIPQGKRDEKVFPLLTDSFKMSFSRSNEVCNLQKRLL